MPSGKAHSTATKLLTAGILATGILTESPEVLWIGLGSATGLVMDPDLDHEWKTRSRGPWWKMYSAVFPHRGVSHWPVLGTLTRAWWLLPLGLVVGWKWIGLWFAGLCLADLLHIIMDKGESWLVSR